MMRSMFSGVSGLRNHQLRMDTIGNNIANVNTVGYKKSRVLFQDMLSQNIRGASSPQGGMGGTNPQQIGLGMTVNSIDTLMTQGSSETTGKVTDMMVDGDGFFVVGNGRDTFYTRAGNFDFDSLGNLVTSSGLTVQGWLADSTTGLIDTNTKIGGITIQKGQAIKPKITTAIDFTNNLNASEVVGQGLSVDVPVYDSLGIEHNITFKLTKNAVANRWDYVASLPDTDPAILNIIKTIVTGGGPVGAIYPLANYPNVDVNPGPVTQPLTQAERDAITTRANNILFGGGAAAEALTNSHSGHLVFTAAGQLDVAATRALNLNNAGAAPAAPNNFWPLTFQPIGANAMTIMPDFNSITQFSSDTNFRLDSQDGYGSGLLSGYSIDKTGVITGRFTNGLTKKLSQVAVANFNNAGGLSRTGENLYVDTNNSGTPDIGAAGSGGRGDISPGKLEMSNVDLSQEFTDMIITQRGFQANSRIITTSDEMLQELVNLKR